MDVRLLSAAEAYAALERGPVATGWDALHEACPWATAFQTRAFARAWYGAYVDAFEPLLVTAFSADLLTGFLALGRDRTSGALVNVGAHQAEYHAWLADAEHGDAFIRSALRRLRAVLPDKVLRFRYLPPGTPTRWLEKDLELGRLSESVGVARPLLHLQDEEQRFAERIRKKSNRSRLNRLRSVCGSEPAGMTVTTESGLAAVIDEIARNYDDRQGSANGARPFAEDARKREFHLRLLREGLLDAYVLRAGGQFMAAILSVPSGETLSVGIFAHATDLADLSPGKFGMAWLARDAARAGYRTIDLTPGGAWKDRFATSHDTVTDLTVQFSLSAARWNACRRGLELSAKRVLAGIGLTPGDLRRLRSTVGK